MRIFLLGEGVTDVGRSDEEGSFRTESTLPPLIRRLLLAANPLLEIDLFTKAGPRLFPAKDRKMSRSRRGFANRLPAVLGLKEGREADAIVMVVDRDGRKNKDRIVELNRGRDELLSDTGKRCAVGVAIEEIEAWLLADEKALRIALSDAAIQRQPDPESLDSRDEASDNNPKGRLERIMASAFDRAIERHEFPDLYGRIAAAADIAVLEFRCPQGFKPFADQVRELSE